MKAIMWQGSFSMKESSQIVFLLIRIFSDRMFQWQRVRSVYFLFMQTADLNFSTSITEFRRNHLKD